MADDDTAELEEQIDRCRRLARFTVDDELRHSLEELAAKFEAKLEQPGRAKSFLLESGGEAGSPKSPTGPTHTAPPSMKLSSPKVSGR